MIIGAPWFDTHPIAMLLGAIVIGFAIGFVFNAYLAYAVRPILAGLEPTTQRITRREALATQVTVFSGQKIIAFGLLRSPCSRSASPRRSSPRAVGT